MKHSPSKGMVTAAKKGVEMSKSPAMSNNALPDTSLKGGKKIASGQQISDDHVRAMAQYHAAHGGACPTSGDAEQCDDLLWGGPAGAAWSSSRVAAMDATSLSEDAGPQLATLLGSEDPFSIELYTRPDLLLEGKTDLAKGEDGLIWAPILRSGTMACRPDPTAPNGRKMEPLVFVPGHAVDPKHIGLADILDAFNDKAVQDVTIPKTHGNNEFENTGFIRQLKIADSTIRPGEKVLLGGHEFLDADAEMRVEKGLIANRSCGILHGYQNTETGKVYPHALEHVALTNKPWVTGMESYGANLFSDNRQVVSLMLSDERPVFPPDADPLKLPKALFSTADPLESLSNELNLADVLWSDDEGGPSLMQIETGLYQALRTLGQSPYYDEDSVYFSVRDVKVNSALVTMEGNSDDAVVIPFTWEDGKLTLADNSQWKWATQEWVADPDAATDQAEIQQALQQNTEMSDSDKQDVRTYLADPPAPKAAAVPDGYKPISNLKQLKAAAFLMMTKHGDFKAARAYITAKAKALNVDTSTLAGFAKKTNASIPLPTDPLKRASMLRVSQSPEISTPTPGGITMGLTREMLQSMNLSEDARVILERQITEDERRDNELAAFRLSDKTSKMETRLARAKEIFGESATGTLATINQLLMADDNDVAVTLLSTDNVGQPVKTNLTVSEIIDRIFLSVPAGDSTAKTALAAKTNLLENPLSGRPALEPDPNELGAKASTGDELLARWKNDTDGELSLAISKTTKTPTTVAA
jgi:hypothetical protein